MTNIEKDRLTAKKRRFCEEYRKDHNAAAAAVRAGYSSKGARQTGHRLLEDPEVQAHLKKLLEEDSERNNVSVDEVLQRLWREATDFDNPGSTRVQALCYLGKHLGMFTDKIEHSGEVEYNRIERVIVYRNEDGELVEGDLYTGEEKKITKQ